MHPSIIHSSIHSLINSPIHPFRPGVRVQKSGGDVEISAPLVISDAGFYNTFQSLLPEHLSPFPRVSTMPKGVRNGVGGFSVYIGLKGTKEELGLKAHNIWAFTGNDLDGICEKYLEAGAEEAGTVDIPLMFISFPSTKDPEWEKRHPGKSTATIITFAAYEWFEQWKDERIMHRGDEYEDLKNRIGKRMWEQVSLVRMTAETHFYTVRLARFWVSGCILGDPGADRGASGTTICPWVSEDAAVTNKMNQFKAVFRVRLLW